MSSSIWPEAPEAAFGLGMLVYVVFLALIRVQNKTFKKKTTHFQERLLIVLNLEFLAFLTLYHFVFGAHRIFLNSACLTAFFSLMLYFIALYFFHSTAFPRLTSSETDVRKLRSQYAKMHLRLLIPLTVPFLLFSFITDIAAYFPESTLLKVLRKETSNLSELVMLLSLMAGYFILLMLFFPFLIQRIWQCKPLANQTLRAKLETVCRRAKFRHAGMKSWTILNHTFTAAIIGIVPRFRYVMFTPKLLETLSDESIEAILAHEIGHSKHKHLLFYPLILSGMVVATALFTLLFADPIAAYYNWQAIHRPSQLWNILYPLSLFIPSAIIVSIYFRYVFGYFSRLFERQADLHVFALRIPAEHMVQALDELGRATGNSHHHPCWHHYSIHERMQFLKEAIRNQHLIREHHQRVKKNSLIYCLLLGIFSLVVLSPFLRGC